MCHHARSDLRIDGVEARTSKASLWAASYVAPPTRVTERFLVGGLCALGLGVGVFFVAAVAHTALDARGWPDDALAPAAILILGGIVTMAVSLVCGAARAQPCALACYGDGEKELACVNPKGELVSHLDGRALKSHEAVRLGWWIVDTFASTTVSSVEPAGDADALRGTGGGRR